MTYRESNDGHVTVKGQDHDPNTLKTQ